MHKTSSWDVKDLFPGHVCSGFLLCAMGIRNYPSIIRVVQYLITVCKRLRDHLIKVPLIRCSGVLPTHTPLQGNALGHFTPEPVPVTLWQ